MSNKTATKKSKVSLEDLFPDPPEMDGTPSENQAKIIQQYSDLDAKAGDTFSHPASKNAHKLMLAHNRSALSDFFKKEGITKAEISFDGYGDSGQIENVSIMAKDKEVTGFAEGKPLAEYVQHTSTNYSGGKRTHSWKCNSTCREALEDFCYAILQSEHGGWEINGGSFGTFTFEMTKGKLVIRLDMNERVEETISTEETY